MPLCFSGGSAFIGRCDFSKLPEFDAAETGYNDERLTSAEYPSGLRGRIANPLFMGSNPISACSGAVGEVGWGPMTGSRRSGSGPAPMPPGGSRGLMAASGVPTVASAGPPGVASADQRVLITSEIWTILSRKLLPPGTIARTLAISALARKASLRCESTSEKKQPQGVRIR